jgi:hypothetical protein
MSIARIPVEVGIRLFGRGWHGPAIERAAGLPDGNRPEPDGGTYEMKAVEIGPSGSPEGDVPIARLPTGPLRPSRESRLLAKMARSLFAFWNDVPGLGPTLFGSPSRPWPTSPPPCTSRSSATGSGCARTPDPPGRASSSSGRKDADAGRDAPSACARPSPPP